MRRSNILKYGPGIQLCTSGVMLASIIFIYFSFSKFLNAQTSINILIVAFFIQSLLVPVLVFKIINLQRLIEIKLENDNVLSFCNSIFIGYINLLKDKGNLYRGIGNNIEVEQEHLKTKVNVPLIEKINFTESSFYWQNIVLAEVIKLQDKILNPKLEWFTINEEILTILTKKIKVSDENIIVFQVNSSPKFVKLDKYSLASALQTIIEAAFKDCPEGTSLQINTYFQKSFLKIAIVIDNNSFSMTRFQNLLDKYFNSKHPDVFREGMGLSLLKGYLKVNHGHLAFKDSEKESCSELLLLINTEELGVKKIKGRRN